MIGYFFVKILIAFIYNTEIFCNFNFGCHNYICCILLSVNYKITQIYYDSLLFVEVFYNISYPELK